MLVRESSDPEAVSFSPICEIKNLSHWSFVVFLFTECSFHMPMPDVVNEETSIWFMRWFSLCRNITNGRRGHVKILAPCVSQICLSFAVHWNVCPIDGKMIHKIKSIVINSIPAYRLMVIVKIVYCYGLYGDDPRTKLTYGKHCQRHNGPEGWVHITRYYTNLDKISISESWLSIKFKISTKHQYLN